LEKNIPLATDAVNRLIQEFSRLPGVGPKSAQRITYYLLRASTEQTQALADALTALKQKTQLCSVCFNISDGEMCPICRNPQRSAAQVLIVEQPQDILALEHMAIYKGRYHVLHGAISPTEGVGSGDIRVKELLERLSAGGINEVIIGTNPTVEGETTGNTGYAVGARASLRQRAGIRRRHDAQPRHRRPSGVLKHRRRFCHAPHKTL
jgi:recombination protein RecR